MGKIDGGLMDKIKIKPIPKCCGVDAELKVFSTFEYWLCPVCKTEPKPQEPLTAIGLKYTLESSDEKPANPKYIPPFYDAAKSNSMLCNSGQPYVWRDYKVELVDGRLIFTSEESLINGNK